MTSDRQSIYDLFGLTDAEIEFIESDADGYRAARREADAQMAHYRDVVIPETLRRVESKINSQLPDGFIIKFDTPTPRT